MTSTDTHHDLGDIPALVEDHLAAFFATRKESLEAIDDHVVGATALLEEFVLGGGKRIRPLFAWVGWLGTESTTEDPDSVLDAVSSLELIQACALLHDDIIDSSDTRRGNPTVHRIVERRHGDAGWAGDPAHFGVSTATLLGDLALAWSDEMLLGADLPAERLRAALRPWWDMRTEVIAGQMLDIYVESSRDERIEAAEKINRYKSAAYTIERPLHLGAALGGGSPELIAAYRGFGHDIGIAYQLRDDLLGVFGDPEVTGKPAGDDLREGKRTVLVAEALRHLDEHDPAGAARLREGIGAVTSSTGISTLTDLIASTGAADRVELRISELTASGLAKLDSAAISPEVRSMLHDLAVRATSRRM
ncbi:polyprenyl synthetase family protein [Corynebacterium pygosceleis]|uniref:Polyprenyl synthetase family protein n=1 Tax=Corynebacterium pygosceleis TaxID=2800406 RepID=A0A9Q4GHH2_9CORY|nr:polyprenyl synthetase family protein [Corynebacterium pygosceleis]MCK7636635.1 polyprenyl synthetase family protein [Corynebacterium pygosceleis]MCK7675209.1 polyprenyl synthetase family protein [Corynebacterium pygosceleis]MCL0120576.1 polyprenyl synthetase family protein [Corynebacterium pygosceleis]MCX7444127.1 polyprenyl synthetase family protein [Corynebacterium pygosceleis]MCX7467388.1 polyprenyl synthetase family protein [Corynebacterium pygosceleis]